MITKYLLYVFILKDVISAYSDGHGNFYDQHGEGLQPALLRWPTAIHYRITSPFSLARVNPVSGILEPHYGVDIGAPSGTHVLATGTGGGYTCCVPKICG